MPSPRDRLRALAYDLGPGVWYRPAWRFIVADVLQEAGLEGPGRDASWLEVGTGPGWMGVEAAAGRPWLDVVAIDTCGAALERARRHKGGSLNLTLRRMDAAQIVYPDGTFQIATAVQSAHHWADAAGVLAEIRRVLAPGGRLYLYEADPEAEIPAGWIARRAGWPPEALLRRRWRRFGMDAARWGALTGQARGAFGEVRDERHGFYRRLVCTR